jgi:hypothetical protein
MKTFILLLLLLSIALSAAVADRARVFGFTSMCNEPDAEERPVRSLGYAKGRDTSRVFW